MSGRGTRKTTELGGAAEAPGGLAPAPKASAVQTGSPSVESVLGSLSGPRLLDLCRLFGCEVHDVSGGKDGFVRKLADQLTDCLPVVLKELGRDELRAVCRRHGLDASPRARADLQAIVLKAAGLDPSAANQRSRPQAPTTSPDGQPSKGQKQDDLAPRSRTSRISYVPPGDDDRRTNCSVTTVTARKVIEIDGIPPTWWPGKRFELNAEVHSPARIWVALSGQIVRDLNLRFIDNAKQVGPVTEPPVENHDFSRKLRAA